MDAPSSRSRRMRCTASAPSSVAPRPWPFRGSGRPRAGRSTSMPFGRRLRRASVVWLCSPNNPTALAEPDGLIEEPARGARRRRRPRPAARHRSSSSTRPTPSSSAIRWPGCAARVPQSDRRSARSARPTRWPGLRVGFAVARPEIIARLNPYRPPGSVSIVSVTVATEVLLDDSILVDNLDRVVRERQRLTDGLRAAGWSVGPVGGELRPRGLRVAGSRRRHRRRAPAPRRSSPEPLVPATRWRRICG